MAGAESKPADGKPAKKSGVLIPILASSVVAALIAAGAVYFVVGGKKSAPAEESAEHGGGEESGGESGGHGESSASGGHGEKGKKGATQYFALTPSFVVNLNDPEASRFLQVDIEVMSHDGGAIEATKLHTPQIRSAILLLLGQQKYQDMETREGKEALQKSVLDAIQKILVTETGRPGIEAVFFTNFVMQ